MSSSKLHMAALLGMAAALLLSGCAGQTSSRQALLIMDDSELEEAGENGEMMLQEVRVGSIVSDTTMRSEVDYANQMTVNAYGHDGSEFVEYCVSVGDEVQEGDVLARVSVTSNERKISEVQAQLSDAQSTYSSGLSQYSLTLTQAKEALAASTPGTLQYEINSVAVEKAQYAYDGFVASQGGTVQSLQSRLAELYAEAANTEILAPMSGMVRGIGSVKKGDTVKNDTYICTIFDPDTYCISFSDTVGNGFRFGGSVDFRLGQDEMVYDCGTIITSPELFGHGSGGYLVDVSDQYTLEELKDLDSIYVMGQSFALDNVLLVPLNAVKEESGSYYVKVYNDGLISKRYFQPAAQGRDPETDEEVVMVSDGLEAGETVIVYKG